MHAVTASSLGLLAVLLAVLLAYFALVHRSYRTHRFYAQRTSVPVAPFLPIGGHVPQLKAYKAAHNTLGCWRAQYDTYGAVHAINYGANVSLKLDDPHYLRGILRTDSQHYHKSLISRLYMQPAIGSTNLLLLEGAVHTRHRQMINPGSQLRHTYIQTQRARSISLDTHMTALRSC